MKRYVAGGADAVYWQMSALWSSPFGADRRPPGLPRPIAVHADREEVDMQFLPGDPIGSRGDLGLSVQLLPEVARLLADLHGSGVQVDRRRGPAALIRSSRRKADELGRPLLRAPRNAWWRSWPARSSTGLPMRSRCRPNW